MNYIRSFLIIWKRLGSTDNKAHTSISANLIPGPGGFRFPGLYYKSTYFFGKEFCSTTY